MTIHAHDYTIVQEDEEILDDDDEVLEERGRELAIRCTWSRRYSATRHETPGDS